MEYTIRGGNFSDQSTTANYLTTLAGILVFLKTYILIDTAKINDIVCEKGYQ